MRKQLQKIIPRSAFAKNVLTLMTGTTIAQAIPVAISPILTRIYSPEDFGVLALFNTLCVVFGVVINGRYEMAIMLPKHQKEAINILKLSFFCALIVSFITLVLVVFFHNYLIQWLDVDSLSVWLYVCPFVFLLLGLFNSLNYYHSRNKNFQFIAKSSVYKSSGLSVGQLFFPYIQKGAFGLISGKVFSLIVAPYFLFKKLDLKWEELKKINFSQLKNVAVKYKEFPLFSVPSALLNTVSMEMPVVLLAKFFSATITGYFSLAHKSISLPMSMISKSFGQVLFQRVSELNSKQKNVSFEVYNVFKKLLLIGCLPLSIVYAYGDVIFGFVFGEEWKEAGVYAGYLSPWLFMVFIASPLSLLLSVFNKLKQSLVYNSLTFISRAVVLLIGVFYFNDVHITIIMFSVVGCLLNYALLQYILFHSGVSLVKSNVFLLSTSVLSFGFLFYSRIVIGL